MARSLTTQSFEFQGSAVRCFGTDQALWFVAKDVCDALGIVWKGSETLHAIPENWKGVRNLRTTMQQRDGTIGFRLIDTIVINQAALFKLVFRSNKPEADAFTNWVASEVLPAIQKTGRYIAKRVERYQKLGKSEEWIEERQEGVQERKAFAATLQSHEATDFPGCTNAIYKPVLGGSATAVKVRLQLRPKDNLRDNLETRDLTRVKFAEMMAADKIERDGLRGNVPCKSACQLAGQAVANALQTVRNTPVQ